MDRSEDKTVVNVPLQGAESVNWLPIGYVLQGRYVIEAQLGAGGFGITYLAKHRYLEDMWVAIKEYLPDGAAVRDSNSRVRVVSERYSKMYTWGLHRFLDEARLLRQFNQPNIVSVQDFFEANDTAYLVMDYVRGRSIQAELDRGRIFDEKTLRSIVYPLLDALRCIHRVGLYHRDISPDNILLREKDDVPVLIDFGSARYAMRMHGAEQGESGKNISPTTIFKQGYSPIEQYEGTEQGSYTDIYALAATLYRTALGIRPPDALKRSGELRLKNADPLEPAISRGQYRFSESFLKTIDAALCLEVDTRPKNVDAWLELFGKPTLDGEEDELVQTTYNKPFWQSRKALFSVLAIVIVAGIYLFSDVNRPQPTEQDIPTLLAQADKSLASAAFSTQALDSAQKLYLQVLTLQQENPDALLGYNAAITLQQFFDAVEADELGPATKLLDKVENDFREMEIDVGILQPGRHRLRLRNSVLALQQTLAREPLSPETWSYMTILLDDMVTLQDGEALAESGMLGQNSLKSAFSAMEKNEFEVALQQIVNAEQELQSLGVSELPAARSKIQLAQRNWQAAQESLKINLLSKAEQHLSVQPITSESLKQAQEAYDSILGLDPKHPIATAGHFITDSLSRGLTMIDKDDLTGAHEAFLDASRTAGDSDIWRSALQQAQGDLVRARQARAITESRSAARLLLTQAFEDLLAAPLGESSLTEAGRKLQEAQTLTQNIPELATESSTASAGSRLTALLLDIRTRIGNADFGSTQDILHSGELQNLSRSAGLDQVFVGKVEQSIRSAEIEWNLVQAVHQLSGGLLDSKRREKARHQSERIQSLDVDHTSGADIFGVIQNLEEISDALRVHDYDQASRILQEAEVAIADLGIPMDSLQVASRYLSDEKSAWLIQQRENKFTSKIDQAILLLQQAPLDKEVWKASEALFEEASVIRGDNSTAVLGKKVVATLKSAAAATESKNFEAAQSAITRAEEILANIGSGRLDRAREQIQAASDAWEAEKQKTIAEALALAERIFVAGELTTANLQQARDAFQSVLKLDSEHVQAGSGLAITAELERFLGELQSENFEAAERQLEDATAENQAALLNPNLLNSARTLLSTEQEFRRTIQVRQKIELLEQRVFELLSKDDVAEEDLLSAEKALQDVAILSQTHQGLDEYKVRSAAGLEAMILLRVFKDELERKQFDNAKITLSEIDRRTHESGLDSSLLDKLSRKTLSEEISWLLAGAARTLAESLEKFLDSDGLDKAEKNYTAIAELAPDRTEIKAALEGIAGLRQVAVARSQRDYQQAESLFDQATNKLSELGMANNIFEAVKQRLDQEHQHWKTLTLERNINAWTGEAIDSLSKSPFDNSVWEKVAALAARISAVSEDDQRGLAVKQTLAKMKQAQQAVDKQRFNDARAYIDEAQSELAQIGVRHPLGNAYRQLHSSIATAFDTQLRSAIEALKQYPVNQAGLSDAAETLRAVLAFLPDNPVAVQGVAVIELLLAADRSITAKEFTKSASLLADADARLVSMVTDDLLVPQLRKTVVNAKLKMAAEKPSSRDIFTLIGVAMNAIEKDPLNSESLNTADNLLRNVLAMYADEPTALAGLRVVDQLRVASHALANGAFSDVRKELKLIEKLLIEIGLSSDVLSTAWRALEAAER